MTWTEYDVASLLYDLCVKLGFCLPPEEQTKLKAEPPEDVEDFTDAVFGAEGMDPRTADQKLWRDVRNRIGEAKSKAARRSIKPMAEAYARLLAAGLVTPRQVITWLDGVIEQETEPDITVIEGSLLQNDAGSLISVLRAVPGKAEPEEVSRLVFGLMAQALERDPECAEAVARELYRMAGERLYPHPEAESLMWLFDDDLELTRRGAPGAASRSGLTAQMELFLRKWAQQGRP